METAYSPIGWVELSETNAAAMERNRFLRLFMTTNYLILYFNLERAKGREAWLVERCGRKKPAECIKYGKCEEVCLGHGHMKATEKLN